MDQNNTFAHKCEAPTGGSADSLCLPLHEPRSLNKPCRVLKNIHETNPGAMLDVAIHAQGFSCIATPLSNHDINAVRLYRLDPMLD